MEYPRPITLDEFVAVDSDELSTSVDLEAHGESRCSITFR
jgi:hypothetical protein